MNELFARFQERLLRMVRLRMDARLKGRVDAEDIVQEALLDAARRLKNYAAEPGMSFFLWLLRERDKARGRRAAARRLRLGRSAGAGLVRRPAVQQFRLGVCATNKAKDYCEQAPAWLQEHAGTIHPREAEERFQAEAAEVLGAKRP